MHQYYVCLYLSAVTQHFFYFYERTQQTTCPLLQHRREMPMEIMTFKNLL